VSTAFDSRTLATRMQQIGVVPVLVLERAEDARPVADALARAGCHLLEVTLRTPAALEAIAALADHPVVTVGAGTVLNAAQADEACAAGARFIVAPGFDRDTVERTRALGVPVVPGIATPTELQAAWNAGLDLVKVFPARAIGGPDMVQALSSICPAMRFMPTGGIGVGELATYLEIPSVLACGGTWLAPPAAIAARDLDGITRNAEIAVTIARRTRARVRA
jgi:2-dehydro-3-deoxyphosphogluconate aldolase/(4S)-4-hydroxy-2-oxoglutarate aldolase